MRPHIPYKMLCLTGCGLMGVQSCLHCFSFPFLLRLTGKSYLSIIHNFFVQVRFCFSSGGLPSFIDGTHVDHNQLDDPLPFN